MPTSTKLPFSKSRRAGNLLFLSGELPLASDGSVPDGIGAQTELTLTRIAETLAIEGMTLADVVQVTVHLVRAEDFPAFNEAYENHFQAPYPTRTTVVAPLVLPAAGVEITVVADLSHVTR